MQISRFDVYCSWQNEVTTCYELLQNVVSYIKDINHKYWKIKWQGKYLKIEKINNLEHFIARTPNFLKSVTWKDQKKWTCVTVGKTKYSYRILVKRPGTHLTGGWVGSRAGLDGSGKSDLPTGNSFLYSLILFTSSVLLSLSWLLCILPLLRTHDTNIHAPCEIRTRNPSNRSAADSRFRPLGHWDRVGLDPRTIQSVASRSNYWAIPVHELYQHFPIADNIVFDGMEFSYLI
jgi:hypothetical protein